MKPLTRILWFVNTLIQNQEPRTKIQDDLALDSWFFVLGSFLLVCMKHMRYVRACKTY